jgi:hypothetical protein
MTEPINPPLGLPEAPPLPARQSLLDRWRGRPWPQVDVLVLKARGCPLCDEVLDEIGAWAPALGLRVRSHGIDGDPTLLERYRQEVPVTFVAGVPRFRGRVDRALLAREAEAVRSRGRP